MMSARELLRGMFDAASASAQPSRCVPPHLPAPPKGHTIVVGAGKASAAMAKALDENWRGDVDDLVVTRYGYSAPCCRIEIIEAAHPVPDAARVTAAQRIDIARHWKAVHPFDAQTAFVWM
jgi:glycerate 2-kinase